MWGRPSCLLQSAGGEANRILLASALSSMRIICPNRVSRRNWIIAVSLGCFVSLRTSSSRVLIFIVTHQSLDALALTVVIRNNTVDGRRYDNDYKCTLKPLAYDMINLSALNMFTAKADKDVMKDGSSVGIELFQVFVFASGRLGFHRLKVNVVVDKTLEANVLATEPRQFPQLPQPDNNV